MGGMIDRHHLPVYAMLHLSSSRLEEQIILQDPENGGCFMTVHFPSF